MSSIKTLILFLVMIQVLTCLLRRSYIGRIILISFRIIRDFLKMNYFALRKIHKVIKSTIQNNNKTVKNKQTNKRVVNGDENVIDMNKYTKNKKYNKQRR